MTGASGRLPVRPRCLRPLGVRGRRRGTFLCIFLFLFFWPFLSFLSPAAWVLQPRGGVVVVVVGGQLASTTGWKGGLG